MPAVVILMSDRALSGGRLLRQGLGQRSDDQGSGAHDRHKSTRRLIERFHCGCFLSGCQRNAATSLIAERLEVKPECAGAISLPLGFLAPVTGTVALQSSPAREGRGRQKSVSRFCCAGMTCNRCLCGSVHTCATINQSRQINLRFEQLLTSMASVGRVSDES